MKELMLYHIAGFSLALLLDLCIGDPHHMPHPVRLMGRLIHALDQKRMEPLMTCRDSKKELRRGLGTVLTVVGLTLLTAALLLRGAYFLHPLAGVALEGILGCYCLAGKSLRKESMLVYRDLTAGDPETARFHVSMIVGRDTACLDEAGITRAAVETVAENTSDGVVAPLLYLALGGPVLALGYKAVNTMDSMIGYHNERYEYFGRAAAKLDDIVNFLPARISALCMILAAGLHPFCKAGEALRIFRRDRYNHKSPNSAQTESVCAGALGLCLGGDAVYFGKVVHKPTMGDPNREIEAEDIRRANELMFMTAALTAFLGEALLILFYFLE